MLLPPGEPRMRRTYTVVLFTSSLLAVVGCQHPTEVASAEPPAIPVSRPASREVNDYVDFTGQTDSVQALTVIARVTGYLVKMPFKEGSEVRGQDGLHSSVRGAGLLAGPLGQG